MTSLDVFAVKNGCSALYLFRLRYRCALLQWACFTLPGETEARHMGLIQFTGKELDPPLRDGASSNVWVDLSELTPVGSFPIIHYTTADCLERMAKREEEINQLIDNLQNASYEPRT